MPPRDEQEYEQRRQQIIDGALEVFSQEGFEKATNKDIAQAAKIGSPGLIYHYFDDKIDLLHQVLLERMPLLRLLDTAPELMQLPPREALTRLITDIMRLIDQWPTLAIVKLVIGESVRNPRVARMVSEIGPGRGLKLLTVYLKRQMELGTLRRMDPEIAARMLIGPVIAYLLTRYIFEQPEAKAIAPQAMAEAIVDTFLRGMAPEPA